MAISDLDDIGSTTSGLDDIRSRRSTRFGLHDFHPGDFDLDDFNPGDFDPGDFDLDDFDLDDFDFDDSISTTSISTTRCRVSCFSAACGKTGKTPPSPMQPARLGFFMLIATKRFDRDAAVPPQGSR